MPQSSLASTKIVATIGPATSSADRIAALIAAGVSVVRLNFSHGEQAQHKDVFDRVRIAAREASRPVAILQDLQGPKLRVGKIQEGSVLEEGAEFRICTQEVAGTAERASTTFTQIAEDIAVGNIILLDDGKMELVVVGVEHETAFGDEVVTRVVRGGELKSNKGINLPRTQIRLPALTDKDLVDLEFGVQMGVDLIALSFVRNPDDLKQARERIDALGGHQLLIAKIEKPQAVDHLDEIVQEADGIMVARGDLGVELSVEDVPIVQKRLIRLCNDYGKPVITATQMLESMSEASNPTRAEASDVANAILDGTDAVMLSGETATGRYPIKTVATMAQIARTTERSELVSEIRPAAHRGPRTDARSVAEAARELVVNLDAKAIAVLTLSGTTARRVSQSRPGVPIIAFTDQETAANQLALSYGVTPVVIEMTGSTDEVMDRIIGEVAAQGFASEGESIVIVGARPDGSRGNSVFLEVHRIG